VHGSVKRPIRVDPMQRLHHLALTAATTAAREPAGAHETPPAPEELLFSKVLDRARARPGGPLAVSVAIHALLATILILVPILLPEALLETPQTDVFRVLIYDPPPPPPPPLPKGAPGGGRRPVAIEAPPTPQPVPVKAEARLEAPVEAVVAPAPPSLLADERAGSPSGSESGVPEGMAEGVPGGVIGGTGTGPVPKLVYDYDRPPRLLNPTKPRYPPDAFIRKVEGVVIVEFVIDATGRVVRARIVQSIPLLDAAALETVRAWEFAPALQHGRPVATAAQAPVTFRIF
jgi:periplasmic protein TonB